MNDNLKFLKDNGVNVEGGLSYLGDESLYREILTEFRDNFENQLTEIKLAYQCKDWEDYTIKVHALKSNARTLGLDELADLAFEHEKNGKEEVHDYINEHIVELFSKANSCYQIINEFLNM